MMMKCKPQSTQFLRRQRAVVGSYGFGLILSLSLAACATGKLPQAAELGRGNAGPAIAGTAAETPAALAPLGKPAHGNGYAAGRPGTKSPRIVKDGDTSKPDDEILPPQDRVNSVYFPLGSYSLDRETEAAIKRHAEKLMGDPRLLVTLIGHTDDLGSKEYNDALCMRRTNAVKQALLDLGVASRQIHVSNRYGYETAPLKPCSTDTCRKVLRRVELRYPN